MKLQHKRTEEENASASKLQTERQSSLAFKWLMEYSAILHICIFKLAIIRCYFRSLYKRLNVDIQVIYNQDNMRGMPSDAVLFGVFGQGTLIMLKSLL